MTLYLLDTNIVSALIKNPKGGVAKHIARVGENNVCTSIIVAAELRYGCAKNGSTRLLAAVESLLSEINVLPLEETADAEYGKLRVKLEKKGQPIGGTDMLIAAHALAVNATMVTANENEFAQVEGLGVENWLL